MVHNGAGDLLSSIGGAQLRYNFNAVTVLRNTELRCEGMPRKSVRFEMRMTSDLYAAIQREAEGRGKSMGMIVREAVEEYVAKRRSADKHELLNQMMALGLPVTDWAEMKEEIQAGRAAGFEKVPVPKPQGGEIDK